MLAENTGENTRLERVEEKLPALLENIIKRRIRRELTPFFKRLSILSRNPGSREEVSARELKERFVDTLDVRKHLEEACVDYTEVLCYICDAAGGEDPPESPSKKKIEEITEELTVTALENAYCCVLDRTGMNIPGTFYATVLE